MELKQTIAYAELTAHCSSDALPHKRRVSDYTGAVPLETRPEGKRAYDLLRNGGADVLIAYRIDRIVRPLEDGTEASIVRMIYHWYTVSDENLVPLTEYAITHKLSKMGIPN